MVIKCHIDYTNMDVLGKLRTLGSEGREIEKKLVELVHEVSEDVRFSIMMEAPYQSRDDPRKKGHLKENILIKEDTPLHKRVHTNYRYKYAEYVEYGTGPHVIRPRNKKALWWPGAEHPVREVYHPGTSPNPFFQRGIERAMPKVNRKFKDFESYVLGLKK